MPFFHEQVVRRRKRKGKRGELQGVKASGRQLAPASRKGTKEKAVSLAGRVGGKGYSL